MQTGEKPWKLVLAFAFFAAIALGLLVGMLVTGESIASGGGAIMLLAAGFAVAGISVLPPLRRRPVSVGGPNGWMWVFILAGAAAWCAAPVVLLIGGAGWGAAVGSPGRALPVWLLAAITWGTAALILYAFVRQRMRIRALRRGR